VLAGPGGGVSVVSGPDGAGFQPYAFNDAGVIVGAVITGSGRTQTYRAARWSAADGFTLIPRPAGTFQSWASDINNAGQIVLNAYSPSGSPADGAYLWTPGAAAPERLPDPPGPPNGRSTVAEAINESGEIVGASGNGSGAGLERAVRWTGAARVLAVLGSPGTLSHALDVNELGTIVGTAVTNQGDDVGHAAAWRGTGSDFVDLGPGLINAINDGDIAVGQRGTPPVATLWSPGTRISAPLGELVAGRGSNATSINNRLHAVGDSNGESVEYTVTPP